MISNSAAGARAVQREESGTQTSGRRVLPEGAQVTEGLQRLLRGHVGRGADPVVGDDRLAQEFVGHPGQLRRDRDGDVQRLLAVVPGPGQPPDQAAGDQDGGDRCGDQDERGGTTARCSGIGVAAHARSL